MSSYSNTGGNLLQYPHSSNAVIYPFIVLNQSINVIQYMDLIILNTYNSQYSNNLDILKNYCSHSLLLKEYKQIYLLPFSNFEVDILDFVVEKGFNPPPYFAELWSCQLTN